MISHFLDVRFHPFSILWLFNTFQGWY